MEVITFNQTGNDLKRVIDRVLDDADYTIITQQGGRDVVVVSRDFFNNLLETSYLLHSPANEAHLMHSIEQYRQGNVTVRTLLDE